MTESVDEYRTKWWRITVAILFVVIPSVMVSLFFLVPEVMFLDGVPISDPHQAAVFRNIARSNACGDTLGIVLCYVQLTTNELSIFRVCTTGLVIWMGLENVMLLVELATYGKFTDPVGETIDLVDFLLQGYMFYKLKRGSVGGSTDEAAPINII